MLAIVDYATRYPEAILGDAGDRGGMGIDAIVLRVGLPKEILTDRGISFTVSLLHQLCRLLKLE